MNSSSDRRQFLKAGASAAGVLTLVNPLAKAFAASCGITPTQTAGPFYPGENVFHSDTDLTVIKGHSERAKGQIIYVKGRVVDQNCKPVKGAVVEIWQACASGRYNNASDPNSASLDPDFKYWAEAITDANGEYQFKTIIPGAYPADTDWVRPPHIHFKVSRIGFKELITQMYFKGNQWNDHDLILQNIPTSERSSVIVDFTPSPAGGDLGSLTGNFDITLQAVRRH